MESNKDKKFPFVINHLESESQRKVDEFFHGQSKLVQIGPEKWLLPESFADYAETIWNFEVRPSDVFVCTFPRSGTVWAQEMIWLICNDLDYKTASKVSLQKRVPFLEFHLLVGNEKSVESIKKSETLMKASGLDFVEGRNNPQYEYLERLTSRRFIKTHLPFSIMPRQISEVGAKVVYVARNPKDVAVSFFHFHSDSFKENFATFAKFFLNDLVISAPYWDHVSEGWTRRHDDNVHFMFYEDMKMNLEKSLRELSVFLEKPLNDEDLPKLMSHLQFDSVKKNRAVNVHQNSFFIRRGEVGGNPEMTESISQEFEEMEKLRFEGSGLKFPQ